MPRFEQENFRRNMELVEKIGGLAEKKHCSPAQLALAWLLAQGDDIVPIPGTKRRKYLAENYRRARCSPYARGTRRDRYDVACWRSCWLTLFRTRHADHQSVNISGGEPWVGSHCHRRRKPKETAPKGSFGAVQVRCRRWRVEPAREYDHESVAKSLSAVSISGRLTLSNTTAQVR